MILWHIADPHFSPKTEKREETVKVTDFIIDQLSFMSSGLDAPNVIVLAGDLVDFHDGAIRLDSETARAAIRFVQRLAEYAPVLVIRGTSSHDQGAPEILREVRSRHPIYVGTELEQIALYKAGSSYRWAHLDSNFGRIVAAFTLFPSVDKAQLYARVGGSIQEGNADVRQLLHDVFAGFGVVNESLTTPRILVGHCMVTGAQFSTGQTAIGEDLEVGVADLRAANCDYVALGHVHAHQCFGPDTCYAGSPGRLNFGETEAKGFVIADVENGRTPALNFVETPARRFAMAEHAWDETGRDGVFSAVRALLPEVSGADVRFRYTVPEEEARNVRRDEIETLFREAGATRVKIESQIIPRERQRAAGISRLTTDTAKLQRYAETVGEEVPEETFCMAKQLETKDAETIAEEELAGIDVVRLVAKRERGDEPMDDATRYALGAM